MGVGGGLAVLEFVRHSGIYFVFRMIDGVPRWYGIAGMLAGGILYEAGISIPIRAGLHRILGKYNKKIGFRVAKLAKMLYSKITGPNSKS
mgnify:CR=1 FL=1